MRIYIEIDKIVVNGSKTLDQTKIGSVLEIELAKLLAERGLPTNIRSYTSSETIHTEAGSARYPEFPNESNAVGKDIAEAVYTISKSLSL
jgi:hypothetical protein